MNNDEYKSAMGKIRASEGFKSRVESSMGLREGKAKIIKVRKWIPAITIIMLVIFAGTIFFSLNWNKYSTRNDSTGDFKITGTSSGNVEASYISVLFMDGYSYMPSEWLGYSRGSAEPNYDSMKGEELGKVTLDLKGKIYTGTPPDFSSTMDIGSEIYAIRDIKKERAVIVVAGNYTAIYYRTSKATADEKEPINLSVSDVFKMISGTPQVSSVELRSEIDGSWMRTSVDQSLLKLINDELPGLPLLNSAEMGQNVYGESARICVNLMFEDGAALNMQVYPEKGYAHIFGGYISVSPELCAAVKELSGQGGQYPSISELLPYEKSEISYLYFENQTDGAEVLCKTPEWSREQWFSMLDYYRVEETQNETNGRLVMTCALGRSESESANIDFYESEDSNIIIKFDDRFYKPVKGQMTYKQLNDYLYNSTDLGLAPK